MHRTVLHVSPHPDDESVAVPCTLLALKAAEWRVVNLVCSLGREPDWERRRGEVKAAAKLAQFENELPEKPVPLSSTDDQHAAEQAVIKLLKPWLANPEVQLVIGPHPEDGHHGHETVARAIRDALKAADRPIAWWMWGIWRDLPQPTLYVPCDLDHVELSERMIAVYRGENSRNHYRAMHKARRRVNAVLGAEQVFGYGSESPSNSKWAELLTEVSYRNGSWQVGPRRQLDKPRPTTIWSIPTGAAGDRILRPLCDPPTATPIQKGRRAFPTVRLSRRTAKRARSAQA